MTSEEEAAKLRKYSFALVTFHVADFIFTVLPLLVSVHFILRKKLRSVFCSLPFFTGPSKSNSKPVLKLLDLLRKALKKKIMLQNS